MLVGIASEPITSAPLVILIYVVLIVLIGSALASVLLRNLLYSIGAFAATMVMVALLYLAVAPFLLFAIQLLVFTTISAGILIGLLRLTTGLEAVSVGPFSREWIVGGGVAAAFLALAGVVSAVTSWPVRLTPQGILCCPGSFGGTLTDTYVVALATVIVVLASAALGAGLLVMSPALHAARGGGERRPTPRGGEPRQRREAR